MAIELFKNLPDRTTPINASKLNGIFNGEESMGSIVVEDIECKNKFYPTENSETQAGVTFIINEDNTVTANGTATANINFYLNSTFYLDVGSYKFSGCTGGSTSTYRLIAPNAVNTNGDTEVTLTEKTLFPVYINVKSGTTLSNVIFKPMIRLATVVDDTYIPHKKFGYNENESMGKIVADDIKCKNICNPALYQNNKYQNYSDSDKSIVDNTYWIITGFQEIEPGTQYTSNLDISWSGMFYDANKTAISKIVPNNSNTGFITPNNAKYVVMNLPKSIFNVDTLKLQFEKGSVRHPYTPYKEFSNKQIYSTNEQVIGTWIDGRNIYKKTISLTFNSSEAYVLVNHGISNFDMCIDNEIITPKTSYGLSWNSRNDTQMSYINDTQLAIDYPTGQLNGTGYITLYYLKSDTSTASEV